MLRTIEELERVAYIENNQALLSVINTVEIETEERWQDMLFDAEENAKSDSLTRWEENNGSVKEYYDFFHDCFARLDGHYPAPSVTSDYDKSVIFDAIERGETVKE